MSIVYEALCSECGKDLDFKVSLDTGDDLCMKISPCEDCMKEKYEEGKTDGIAEAEE